MSVPKSGLTLVTSYVNPDIDGIAATFAYAELLRSQNVKAEAAIFGEPIGEVVYVLNRFSICAPEQIHAADQYDHVVLVDASDPASLQGHVTPEKVVEVIDHRLVHSAHLFPNADVQIEQVGSVATLIAERFQKAGVLPSPGAAILLESAIISNTVNFQASVTTDRDRAMAKWLNGIAGFDDNYSREMFTAKSDFSGPKLIKALEADAIVKELGGKNVSIAQIEMIGAERLMQERGQEIAEWLNQEKARQNLDLSFLNLIELDNMRSWLVAGDDETKTVLEKALGLQFAGPMAASPKPLMRKQVAFLLKQALEVR